MIVPHLGNGASGGTTPRSQASDRRIDPTIIVAIVAAASTVGVAMIGQGGLIDRFVSPVVEVTLDTTQEIDTGLYKVIATVTNYGSRPADNLILAFKAPETNKFLSIRNEFSTTDLQVRKFIGESQEVQLQPLQVHETIDVPGLSERQTYVEVHAKKFSHGAGSKIILALKVEGDKPNLDPKLNEFDASAVYDQGSARWVQAKGWSYKGFVDTVTKPNFFLVASFVAIVILIELVLWWGQKKGWFVKTTGGKVDYRRVSTNKEGRIIRGLAYFVIILGIVYSVGLWSSDIPIILVLAAIVIVIIEFVLKLAENRRWFETRTQDGSPLQTKREFRQVQTSTQGRIIRGLLYFLIAFTIWNSQISI